MMTKHLDNPLDQCQLKFDSEKTGEFQGYASVFNSNDADNDTMLPGAFTKSIRGALPPMFINHNHRAIPVGDWLSMSEDHYGLFAKGKIDMAHIDGPSLYSAMKRGAMTGMSIGFTSAPDDFTEKDGGGRIFHNLNLKETSVVTFPAEDRARISAVKADLDGLSTLKDYESYLRDVGGFSRSMATAVVSQIVKHVRCENATADSRMTATARNEVRAILENMKSKL